MQDWVCWVHPQGTYELLRIKVDIPRIALIHPTCDSSIGIWIQFIIYL